MELLHRLAASLGGLVERLIRWLPGPPSDAAPPPDVDGSHGHDLTAEDMLRINAERKDGHGGVR